MTFKVRFHLFAPQAFWKRAFFPLLQISVACLLIQGCTKTQPKRSASKTSQAMSGSTQNDFQGGSGSTTTGTSIGQSPASSNAIPQGSVVPQGGTTALPANNTSSNVTQSAASVTAPASNAQSGAFCGGNGTKASPYLICTAKQFDSIRGNYRYAYFKLQNDIDLNENPIVDGENFHSAVSVQDFDGNSKVISNPIINGNSIVPFITQMGWSNKQLFASLFFTVAEKIHNLQVKNLKMTINTQSAVVTVGGLASGLGGRSEMDDVSVDGNITINQTINDYPAQGSMTGPGSPGLSVGGLAPGVYTCTNCRANVKIVVNSNILVSDPNPANGYIFAAGGIAASTMNLDRASSIGDITFNVKVRDGLTSGIDYYIGGLLGLNPADYETGIGKISNSDCSTSVSVSQQGFVASPLLYLGQLAGAGAAALAGNSRTILRDNNATGALSYVFGEGGSANSQAKLFVGGPVGGGLNPL